MKKTVLLLASAFLLVSCNNGGGDKSWTISFESNGGSEVASLTVLDGRKASKPEDPTRDGYSFLGWYQDQALATAFDWETAITADWTLYASWDKIETPAPVESSSSGDASNASSSSGEDSASKKGHGPEGSSLVSWYLVGSGSLWDASTGWTVSGGIQLYSNPSNSDDKGCLLGVSFEEGDTFKVTDGGSTWFGYENVDKNTDGSVPNAGVSSFAGDDDGYGKQNIKCTVSGTYDVYVNPQGVFWIQASN